MELLTRPVHPESRAVLDARWAGLPEHVKTPNQLLGRSAVGCEGTHGVFPRCNRYSTGLSVDGRFAVLVDPDEPADVAARDRLLAHHGGMFFGGQPRPVAAARVLRALVRHPGDVQVALSAARRVLRRAGGARALWRAWRAGTVRMRSFVVHHFMDASVVGPAWALLEEGQSSEDPAVREAQERLGACMYTMAHPETGRLVPACTQHSVLGLGENARLRKLLPLTVKQR